MENFGAWNNNGGTNNGSIHGPGYTGTLVGASYTLPDGDLLSSDYHIFSIEWAQNSIEFFVDGIPYETQAPATIPSGAQWVFNAPFFLIMNVAVGGPTTFLGSPSASTVFPQTMLVDYVRVYSVAHPAPPVQ
jgi:beta-glucanase (GH16 family)